jgi:hypothetical protein
MAKNYERQREEVKWSGYKEETDFRGLDLGYIT